MEGVSKETSKRYQTLPLEEIDAEKVAQSIHKQWQINNDNRENFLKKREQWTSNWRDLNTQAAQGPWENSSDFRIPLTLINGKAIHARLWQLFGDTRNFFGVRSRQEAFIDREEPIRNFMQYVLERYGNSGVGFKDTFDKTLWDNVFDGSGYFKLYWQRDIHQFMDVVRETTIKETSVIDPLDMTGVQRVEDVQTTIEEKNKLKTIVVESPQVKRILTEDIILPLGEDDPQGARYCIHRIFMTSDDLKSRAQEGKFDKDAVEAAIEHRGTFLSAGNGLEQADEIKRQRAEMDGFYDFQGYMQEDQHGILEWYGKLYVKPELDEEDERKDIDSIPQEVVVWVHQASGKVLGWTYLYRISPSGIRPIFKMDFIKFPDRSQGVGVGEVLAPINQAINATYNLRQDNGILASTPFGFYRASSGLKPQTLRVEPGTLHPVDDVNDVRIVQFPFLNGFGYQEEDRLTGYAERLLTVSDLTLGRSPNKVGLFRTASGAQAVQSESGIQLEIHFDRIARTLNRFLSALFGLCRERIPADFYYRITGDRGEPIFGKVDRSALAGDYDFEVNVDILGEDRGEAQQKAVMMLQTLINPAFMNTGVVTPNNLYSMARNFLQKNRMKQVDNFITRPQGFSGSIVTPSERVFRIVVGQLNGLLETVRLDENHEEAMKFYESFEGSDEFGLLTKPEQLQALQALKEKHMQLLQAQQAGANPNLTGMQIPREGFNAGNVNALASPEGQPNGPVV